MEDSVEESNENICSCHKCTKCGKEFSQSSHLYRHIREVHKLETVFPTQKVSCSLCHQPSGFKTLKQLQNHLKEFHELPIVTENLVFKSEQEFVDWKLQVERETSSQYVKNYGSKRRGGKEITTYNCNRSGYFKSKGNNKRTLKIQGSNKIGAYCPSSIRVVKTVDEVHQVEYVPTHVGHKQELGHLTLSTQDKEWLAALLLKGVDSNNILKQVRDSLSGSLERIHLLTKKDLLNLESVYNINKDKRNQNDKISVESWIDEMKSVADSPILLYKPQGVVVDGFVDLQKDDFFLAIMNNSQTEMLQHYGKNCVTLDTTHGMNVYGFDLTTLLVLDDLHSGFPCAFLFSNRQDERTLATFFQAVKEKAGLISAQVMMTDDAEAFYNAWKKIMGEVPFRLLCSWHVDHSWRRNLVKIVDREKQVAVYKMLRTIMQETDINAFEKMMANFKLQLISDEVTKEFGEYFITHYMSRPEVWAFCYRLGCGINTNMHLESMHKTLKYVYLKGKKVKRLDKTINALMTFLRDRMFDRIIIICKGKLNKKLTELRERHRTSETLSTEIVLKQDAKTWSVASSTITGETYIVKASNTENCTCALRCNSCAVCIHRYSCTCHDYSIKWNMCKHIHLVCRNEASTTEGFSLLECNDEEENWNLGLCVDLQDNHREVEMQVHIDQLKGEKKSSDDTELLRLKEETMKEAESIMLKISEAQTVEQLTEIRKLLKPVSSTLNILLKENHIENSRLTDSAECKEPANKSIQKQRFYSLKRKNISKKLSLSKPTAVEAHRIAVNLSICRDNPTTSGTLITE